jgi:putative ABC transport system permease protein
MDLKIAFRAQPVNVATGVTTERVTGMLVSGDCFGVLGITMAAGAPIGRDDDVVLSHQYWQRRFGRSPEAIGTSIRINGDPMTRFSNWKRR